MIWLSPDTQHELLWDYGMCADTSRGAAIRELINRACKGALAPAPQKVPSLSLSILSLLFAQHIYVVHRYISFIAFVPRNMLHLLMFKHVKVDF